MAADRLRAEGEMKLVANRNAVSKVEGKSSQSAERRLVIFPTSNMRLIMATGECRRNAFANGEWSG